VERVGESCQNAGLSITEAISMAAFKKIEDIQVWRKARCVTKMVYELTNRGGFERDFGLRDQVRRACVSIMANVAQGFGRRTNRDFSRFLDIAYGSACEAQSHFYVAADLGYVTADQFEVIYSDLNEVAKMLRSLVRHLRLERE
jgi:four helix bundle protein